MKKLSSRRALAVPALVGLGLVLASCADEAPQDTWQPEGENAQDIHNLQWPVFAIAGVVMLIVMAAVGWAVFRYRDRGQPIPKQTHGKPSLEIALTILPALILVGVAIPTVGTLMALSKTDDTQCVVNITGQQWWWEIDYPTGMCGDVEIASPIVTSGQLVIPTGTNVLMRGTSRDVIHSFWVPKINGKRDVVPGRIQTLRLQADHPGIYAGQCAEFCGLSHANMRMEIVALSPTDFQTWVDGQLAPYVSPTDPQAARGEDVFIQQCSRCHQVNGLVNDQGNDDPADDVAVIAYPEDNVYAGAAPNLSHLMSRNTFAGATWDLVTQQCRDRIWNASPEEFGALYLEGVTDDCFNPVDLREWIRNAPEKKPMYADQTELGPTNGLYRGMPFLALSEDQIDDVIAYLLELN